MAIDTATKRAAALGVGMPPGLVLPVPDGTVDANDRAQLAGVYLPQAAATVPAFNGPNIDDFTLLANVAMSPRDFSPRFAAALPLTFTLQGGAITGLSLSSAGVLSGTPTAPGVYTLRAVRASDGSNPDADSNTFTITVTTALFGLGDGDVGDGDLGSGDLGDGGVGG